MTSVIPSGYKKLVSDIVRIAQNARKVQVSAYWEIGQRIVKIEQDGVVRARYGARLIEVLSKDLTKRCGAGFSDRNLARMRSFYLLNPILPPAAKLDWTRHVELFPIENKIKRLQFEKRALREGLNREELRALVRSEVLRGKLLKNRESSQKRTTTPLPFVSLGPFHTYQIISRANIHSRKEERLLDLGFGERLELDQFHDVHFPVNTIVTSIKNKNGTYSLRRGEVSSPFFIGQGDPAPTDSLYTYKAYVERVIDGDTLKLEVHVGFGLRFTDKFRLKGIDCMEMDTPEGVRAKKFVESELASSEFVTVKSNLSARKEKWGRYLVDIFYNDDEANQKPRGKVGNGRDRSLHYLNQILIDKGLAVRMTM